MKSKRGGLVVLLVCLLALPAAAWAQDGVTEGDLNVEHGQVNWTDRTITATGSGAPDLKAPNVAVARLGAERVAKLDALRNIMETLKGVRLESEITVENQFVTNSKMRSKVEGVVRNFKVLKTKYYSDGGVDLIVQVSLDGKLGSTLIQPGGKSEQVPKQGDAKNTGLILDARGTKAKPALSPSILDEEGNILYNADLVSEDAFEKLGVVGYFKDLDVAKKDQRAGKNPLIVKASKLASKSKTNLVLDKADADALRITDGNLSYLADAKVIIVVD